MTQPEYVPLTRSDKVRAGEVLPPAERWFADRPGDLRGPGLPEGRNFGNPGPDLGYGLKLARSFADRLVLAEGEHAEDAVAGCFAVATKRASLFGRAPVIYDLELAFTVWGFLSDAPAELVEARKRLFAEASHHYEATRAIADAVPDSTLRLSPADARTADWRTLLER